MDTVTLISAIGMTFVVLCLACAVWLAAAPAARDGGGFYRRKRGR